MYIMEEENVNKTAKSALRDVLRAKLKSSSSIDESKGNEEESQFSSHMIVDVVGSDSSESDEKQNESVSGIPLEERRVRNRLAARKCREKRKQRIWNLEKICNSLEGRISLLQNEITGLDNQKKSLTKLLQNHPCVCLGSKHTAVIANKVTA